MREEWGLISWFWSGPLGFNFGIYFAPSGPGSRTVTSKKWGHGGDVLIDFSGINEDIQIDSVDLSSKLRQNLKMKLLTKTKCEWHK